MFTMSPEHYHPAVQLFQDYYMARRQANNISTGRSQSDKQAGYVRNAYRDGISHGYAALANEIRCAKYADLVNPNSKMGIPMVVGSDFNKFLETMVELYDGIRAEYTPKQSDEFNKAEQEFIEVLLRTFMDIARPEPLERQMVQRRQEKILAGEVVAESPEEKDWLAEVLKQRREELHRIEMLGANAGVV